MCLPEGVQGGLKMRALASWRVNLFCWLWLLLCIDICCVHCQAEESFCLRPCNGSRELKDRRLVAVEGQGRSTLPETSHNQELLELHRKHMEQCLGKVGETYNN